MENKGMRLAKFMSNAGVAARRKCEELIAQGHVTVNGKCVTTPVCIVVPGVDVVCYQGKKLNIAGKLYFAFNKPAGFTCSRNDPHARRVIFDLLPEYMSRLYYVGRLDRDTEGLLILTSDGDFAQALTHPSFEIEKRYMADCQGSFTPDMAQLMIQGVEDEGDFLKARRVRLVRSEEDRSIVEVVLTEGRKREVRRLCAAAGLEVVRLARVSIGNLQLGTLPSTQWRELTSAELEDLKRLTGMRK